MGKPWENGGLPSGTCLLWKDPPCSMEKSAILTGPFSIVVLIYQRVDGIHRMWWIAMVDVQ